VKDGRMIVPTQPGLGVTLSENVPGWTRDSAKFGKHAGLSPTNNPSIQCDHSAGRSKQADFFPAAHGRHLFRFFQQFCIILAAGRVTITFSNSRSPGHQSINE